MTTTGSAPSAARAESGGRKDQGVRFDLIPVAPLWQVAEVYTTGSLKYEARNWERGFDWSKSYAAMQRHMARFWMGESYDPEGGQHHLASVVFHALALMEFETTHPELDDRPKDAASVDFERIKKFVVDEASGATTLTKIGGEPVPRMSQSNREILESIKERVRPAAEDEVRVDLSIVKEKFERVTP